MGSGPRWGRLAQVIHQVIGVSKTAVWHFSFCLAASVLQGPTCPLSHLQKLQLGTLPRASWPQTVVLTLLKHGWPGQSAKQQFWRCDKVGQVGPCRTKSANGSFESAKLPLAQPCRAFKAAVLHGTVGCVAQVSKLPFGTFRSTKPNFPNFVTPLQLLFGRQQ